MLRGMFKCFAHDHYFEATGGGTLMRDVLRFAAPLGPLGWLAETLVLRRYLTGFLMERNTLIKQVAEDSSHLWVRYTEPSYSAHPSMDE